MQQYVLDAWEPVESARISPASNMNTTSAFTNLKFRHYLVLVALPFLFVGSPLAWYFTGTWAGATLVAGLAFLLISFAALLAPDAGELQTE
jgi:hypothetical protein